MVRQTIDLDSRHPQTPANIDAGNS